MTKKYLIMPDIFFVFRAINKKMKTMSEIQVALMITYSHIHHIIREMERNNWLIVEKQGRQNNLSFTEEGLKVANDIETLFERIGITDDNFENFRRASKFQKEQLNKKRMEVNKMSEEEIKEEVQEEVQEEVDESGLDENGHTEDETGAKVDGNGDPVEEESDEESEPEVDTDEESEPEGDDEEEKEGD